MFNPLSTSQSAHAGAICALAALAANKQQSLLLAYRLRGTVRQSNAEQIVSWSAANGFAFAPHNEALPTYDFFRFPVSDFSLSLSLGCVAGLLREAAAELVTVLVQDDLPPDAINRDLLD
jgi:hypothetical protein